MGNLTGRPRLLDGQLLYAMFQKHQSIAAIIRELEEYGIQSPYSKNGRWSVKAIKKAIDRDVPGHGPLTLKADSVAAKANWSRLRAKYVK